MKPTDEQIAALRLFLTGEPLVIEAGAGTGKTSTLRLLAAGTRRRGRYLAFNKAIVEDVQGRITKRVTANTAHSLAFRAVGKNYVHRLQSPRMKREQIASYLGIRGFTVDYGGTRKPLAAGWCAGHVMRALAIFCRTLDDVPGAQHFEYVDGIDVPTADGKRTWANNLELRKALEPALRRAWDDITRPEGELPFRHDHYLKMWQLSRPRISTDFILFDEAQDADPVMVGVVTEQADHAQIVAVGDGNQQIYAWRGAINALEGFAGQDQRCYLTQSWRFGPDIAAEANRWLTMLDSPFYLTGTPTIPSTVVDDMGDDEADAILCRTNARAMRAVLDALGLGIPVHLVGGGRELADFCRGVRELTTFGSTGYHELACFNSWDEVRQYVDEDQQGDDLRLLVKLVDDFGVDTILNGLEAMPGEDRAQLIVSTAHKAKGREWERVKIADDFADRELLDEELRLRYVAVTRARLVLDTSGFTPQSKPATAAPTTLAL